MKKILLSTILIISFTVVNAQKSWSDIGVKGGYGLTAIINNNVWNDKNVASLISYGHFLGGKFGFNFNKNNELYVDVTAAKVSQDYKIRADILRYDKSIDMHTLNIGLVYRNHSNGGYFEVGPQYVQLRKVVEHNSIVSDEIDLSKRYLSNYYAAVLGFGANILGTKNLNLLLGVRFSYGLNDLIDNKSQTNFSINDAYYNPVYNSYKNTNPLTCMISLELNYDLGYFAKTKCGKKRIKFVSFD